MKAILNFFAKLFGKTDTKTKETTSKPLVENSAPTVEEVNITEINTAMVSPSISIEVEDKTEKETETVPTRKKPTKPAVKKMKKAPVKAKTKTNKKK